MLPFFYLGDTIIGQNEITLDEETSRHIVQVLRMKIGERLNLTDGKGKLVTAEITGSHKKHCTARILPSTSESHELIVESVKISLAISLLKNTNRFEWFLEKATEIGVSEIIPLLCERTEKEKFRFDRMQQICISAMLQSQQVWLPILHQPIAYELLFRQEEIINFENKFIAYCGETIGKSNLSKFHPFNRSTLILIGPEGDFTNEEVDLALQNKFQPISLGATRLRSETAGMVAAVLSRLL